MRTKKPILLVEDDQADVMTMKRALRDVQITNRLQVAGDGEEALAFLESPENEKPGIILLDLNLPKVNGIFKGCKKRRDAEKNTCCRADRIC